MDNKILADNRELIQNVTEEVLKRVLKLLHDKSIEIKEYSGKVMFLKPKEEHMEKAAADLVKKISLANYDVTTSCENINISCAQCGHCKKVVEDCSYVVVYGFDNKELVDISLGIISDERESYIADAILKGKSVYVINEGIEYKKYKNTCNNNFYSMYESYEKKLKSFGIQVVDSEMLISEMHKTDKVHESSEILSVKESPKQLRCIDTTDKDGEYFDLTHKKLICEGELRKASCGGNKSVCIDAKAILTPLAMDFVRRNKLIILQR